jgi:hypothetical protein
MTKLNASNAHMRKLIDVQIAALPEMQYENRARISQPAGNGE